MSLFSRYAGFLPPALQHSTRIMVSTAIFWAAIVRNMWWWLGCRPASRVAMKRLLAQGITCVLNPGGVQECLWLEKGGAEHVFLRSRVGFVRWAGGWGQPALSEGGG